MNWPEPKESDVQKALRDVWESCGVFFWKQWQGPYSQRGISDFIGIRKVRVQDLVDAGVEEVGVFFAVETKRPRKAAIRQEQEAFIANVLDQTALATRAKSVDEMIEAFSEFPGAKLPVLF